jgi:hypothetical protein
MDAKSRIKKFLRELLIIVIGIALAMISCRLIDQGYFRQWEKLPYSNGGAKELVTVTFDGVYIKSSDGAIYRCLMSTEECWVRDTIPQQAKAPIVELVACDFSQPEFFFSTNPPRNVKDCIQYEIMSEEGVKGYYVVDANGAVWRWERDSSGLFNFVMTFIVCPILGLIVGSLTLALIQKRMTKKQILSARSPMK